MTRLRRRPRPVEPQLTEGVLSTLDGVTAMLVFVIVLAIAFDYVNGFHDTANAIATSVATRALAPRYAILMATAFNFIGAFAGTAVAKTIASGLVDEATTTQVVIAAALIGAIIWNLITWQQGLPSSSSHALIGGLLGATIVAAGTGALNINGIVNKVLIPMVTSPLLGFAIAFALMVALYWIFRRSQRKPMAARFRRLQVGSAAFMAFAHGSNDAQKTMGIITLALFSAGVIDEFIVPTWVIVVSATALSLGTAVGGWRIMHTMGQRVAKLEPVHGFAAETTAASILLVTAELGMPVSTTQVISGAIMGVGSSQGLRHVRWGVARRILVAWVLTLPAAGILAAVAWLAMTALGLSGPPIVDRCRTTRRKRDDLPHPAKGPQVLRTVHCRRRQPGGGDRSAQRDGRTVRPAR
jgi:PiT family inorganic phosphate transporter